MSRAFVKEPDGDQVINELPDRVHSPHVNYVTPAGLRQLQERRDGILARWKIISGAVSAENKKQLMLIDRDLRYYEERIRRAVLIDPGDQPKDEVHFGAKEIHAQGKAGWSRFEKIMPCLDIENGRVVKGVQFVNIRDAGLTAAAPPRARMQGGWLWGCHHSTSFLLKS